MTSYIGHSNLLETGTVSVTSAATGYAKENAYDWLPYDYWKAAASGTVYLTVDMGSATAANCWGLAFHDLHDHSGTIKPQYSTDNVTWNDFDTVQTPSSGLCIFRIVTARNVRYYRFQIASTSVASVIGALFIGQALALPNEVPIPFVSPVLGRDNKIMNSTSEGGSFLGRSRIKNGVEFAIEQRAVTTAWMDSNWDDLADHLDIKPIFFTWDHDNRPTECVFAWADKPIKPPARNNPNLIDFSVAMRGLRE